ncbi:MAG: nitrile hydratase accessory protein [Pseudonocardiales bacterium]|nr:nitrile hydratase accessory protein [Pseudonocardiales bacterium]
MTASAPLEVEGPAAPPRSNGELVFAEPWESRAFGLTVTLYDAGAFEWSQFQAALIAQIAAWERGHEAGECFSYYGCWLAALESVLTEVGMITTHDIADRAAALATRPSGHDHDHDH